MNLDVDLARKILVVLGEKGQILETVTVEVEGYSEEEIVFHLILMDEAGLVDGINFSSHSEGARYQPRRLTWAGYDFLETARSDTRWEQAKKMAGDLRGITFQILQKILVSLLETELKDVLT